QLEGFVITMKQHGPWALIAGGSEGVGASFAHKLARIGMNLMLVARRSEPLETLAQNVRARSQAEVRTLSLDLKRSDALERVREVTDDIEIGLLIFNAGDLGSAMGSFIDRNLEDVLAAVRVTVIGQTTLAHHFGARMAARGRGGIILIGSLSGNAGVPNQATYCAAKAYSQIFAEALWCELKPRGIDVLSVVLGITDTPARARAGLPDVPGAHVFTADDIAQHALDNLVDGGPVYVPPPLAELFQLFSSSPRRQIAELMSGAAGTS
ncbi:MAG: SDR family NAD(P)-dependent oxidoreductase, partial [Steroidobacteraceae bacterium]